MYFEEAFGKIKTSLQKTKVKAADNHFAVQVRMTDYDCGGTFYIEQKDGNFFVEPYNYFDFDADVEASFKDIKDIADGKLDMKKAVEDGKIIVSGNLEELLNYGKQLKKAEKKPAAKKTAAKKAPAKKAVKAKAVPEKAEEKKAEVKTAAKPEPKKAEKPAAKKAETPKEKTEKNTAKKAVK